MDVRKKFLEKKRLFLYIYFCHHIHAKDKVENEYAKNLFDLKNKIIEILNSMNIQECKKLISSMPKRS